MKTTEQLIDDGDFIHHVAQVAHEVNRAYCEAIGDNSQPKWEDAPDWQVVSAMNGVVAHIKNPNLTPEESHNLWKKQKLDEGWVHGKVKDPEKKTHPCIVPTYQDLPLEQRVKDNLFKAVVLSMVK